MHDLGMYDRPHPLDLTGFEGSGADFLDRYKPYIYDSETVVANPHKACKPDPPSPFILKPPAACAHVDQPYSWSRCLCRDSQFRCDTFSGLCKRVLAVELFKETPPPDPEPDETEETEDERETRLNKELAELYAAG